MPSKCVEADLEARSSRLLDLGEAITAGAHRFPARGGARDLSRVEQVDELVSGLVPFGDLDRVRRRTVPPPSAPTRS